MAALEAIAAEVRVCTLCRLHLNRTHAVPGEGRKSTLMFVGEAPGREEDVQGRPFVGRAGKILDDSLQNAGIDRKTVFITSVVKCRPPHNRVPLRDEIETCVSAYLRRQINVISPKIICLLGGVAIKTLLGETRVAKIRGRVDLDGQTYFATYHPAAAGRNHGWKKAFYEDLCEVKRLAALKIPNARHRHHNKATV